MSICLDQNYPETIECPGCSGSGTIEIYYNEFDCYGEECPSCCGEGVIIDGD